MVRHVLEKISAHWLMQNASDAMLVVDRSGRVRYSNPVAAKIFGYAPDGLDGLTIETLIPERFRLKHQAQRAGYAACPHARAMGGAEYTLYGRRKNGMEFPADVSLAPIETDEGPLVVTTVYDISERKRAEERQTNLIHDLKHANEELKNFAYVVSHDLKAPLRAIGSLADWISTDYGDKFDDEGKQQMRLLIGRVRRMDGLIDGILQYSRVGRIRESCVAVGLNTLIAEVIDLLQPPTHIAVKVESELPTVTVERTRIQQVFQNLIGNAIKYMDKPAGEVRIGCAPDGDGWRFHVRDNGPGIEARHFEKIFQLFQTLAPRDRVESTGVGLALVKKIVELYDGKVWIESRVGEGSTFFFTLPGATANVCAIRA